MVVSQDINQRRRLEILEAAVHVLTMRGLADTRVADVASRCGVSPSLVHYYFDSREQLLLEALVFANDRFFLRLTRALRTAPSAREQLALLIDLSLPGQPNDPEAVDDWALWLELWVQALRDPEMARERETLEQRFRLTIRDIVERGRATGEFPPGDDPRRLGVRLGVLIDGLGVQILMNDVDFPPEEARTACLEMALVLIGAPTGSREVPGGS